jgi:hypothetical protein
MNTDEFVSYNGRGGEFKLHLRVDHSKGEYARGEAHVNTIESFWALLKRGLGGIYQHVSGKHLMRYLDEFAYRFNTRQETDGERIEQAVRQAEGKRLLYRLSVAEDGNGGVQS